MSLNMQDMLSKVQELQARVNETQEKLRALETTVEVGGGMVRVTVNGKQEIRKITIEKSVVSPDDVELLEDLVLSAVNKAIEQSQKMAQDEMGKATSGMLPSIPGLDLGNFGL
jgi:DNA-binding YbaB/EbfC family protein